MSKFLWSRSRVLVVVMGDRPMVEVLVMGFERVKWFGLGFGFVLWG